MDRNDAVGGSSIRSSCLPASVYLCLAYIALSGVAGLSLVYLSVDSALQKTATALPIPADVFYLGVMGLLTCTVTVACIAAPHLVIWLDDSY